MDDGAGWVERWREGRIGFHEGHANALLERHVARIASRPRVLVPMCGKAEDLAFLASRGHHVIGVELVEDAVRTFFDEHRVTPTITPRGALVEYATDAIVLYAGDIFATSPELLGPIDAVYDRAALVALPIELRPRYVEHLRLLAPGAPALQITLEYPQDQMTGPPFAVLEAELRELYAGAALELLDEAPDTRVREGAPPMLERCFLITP